MQKRGGEDISESSLAELLEYVRDNLAEGYPQGQIKRALVCAGWPGGLVNDYLFKIRKNFSEGIWPTPETFEEGSASEKRGENMAKKIGMEEAKQYLRDVPQETAFWVNSGPVLKNLFELSEALKTISDELLAYHVNKDKNDFSSWIEGVVGDKTLAQEISKAKTRAGIMKKVNARVAELKKIVG